MAVSIQETVFNHVANGVTVDFAYGCQALAASDLVVFVDDVETTVGFTVNGVGVPAGGSVTFDVAPANGKKIRLERVVELERVTDYQQTGDFLARVVNPDFDRIWMALQRVNYLLGTAIGSVARVLKLGDADTNGTGAYRAQQNRIVDVGDAVDPQDAANRRSVMALIETYIAGIAGGIGTFIQSGIGAVVRTFQDKLREVSVSITDYGGSPLASGATNSAALSAAATALYLRGSGFLDIPAGEFRLANVGPGELGGSGATSWDNRYCFRFTVDNIIIRMAPGAKLKLGDGENAHVIQFGQRSGSSVSVSGCGVIGGEIDGNRANQVTPTDTENHFDGINIATGCTNFTVSGIYIHDLQYYGLGVQRDNHHNGLIERLRIENTGADGLDWKDDSDASTGNVLRHIRVRNWGMVSTLTGDQAGIDLRSGVHAHDLDVASPGSAVALNGIRLQNGTPGATPVQPTRVHSFRGAGANAANSVGARVITRYGSVTDGYIKAFSDGYSLSDPDGRFQNLIAESNGVNFRLWGNATAGVEADTGALVGLISRSASQANFVFDSVDEITLVASECRNGAVGYDIRAGCTNIRILGGSCAGNTTQVSDLGTGTIIQFVSGYRTRNVVSDSVAIDSTGVKTFSIPHGLPFTPNHLDYTLNLRRNTNVGDWSVGYLCATSADATNLNGQLRVLTASATVGAVVDVVATVDAKNR